MYDTLMLFTLFHTALSLVALLLGFGAIATLFNHQGARRFTKPFLITTTLSIITGFMFPFTGFTPAIGTGIAALAVLLMMLAAYKFKLRGHWRTVYVGGMVASVFFQMFVTVAQSFQKIPALNAYAPTGAEPTFAIAESIVLLVFVAIGVAAARTFRPVTGTKTVAPKIKPKAKRSRR
ncbi:MAG TPA: hypothetical protein VHP58_05405 [Alphaproteobacteria bacterium]|nr:hypothetical protein [Alphaproteobacteria bacterium]